jgi:hypothetical protein
MYGRAILKDADSAEFGAWLGCMIFRIGHRELGSPIPEHTDVEWPGAGRHDLVSPADQLPGTKL